MSKRGERIQGQRGGPIPFGHGTIKKVVRFQAPPPLQLLASSSTANLSIVESGDILSSAIGIVVVPSASIAEAADAVSSSTSVLVILTLSRTEISDVLAASSGINVAVSASITEAGDALSGTTGVGVSISASLLDNDGVSGSCTVLLGSTLNYTELPDQILSAGVVIVRTNTNITETSDTAAGGLLNPPVGVWQDTINHAVCRQHCWVDAY